MNTGINLTVLTDQNGIAVTEFLPYDKYVITETKTNESYYLDENKHFIIISEDKKVYEFGLINYKIMGQIKVIKTDGKTKTPLAGVVFDVLDQNGVQITEITTDENGIAITDLLEYGHYTIAEKTAKSGYVLDDTMHEIEITEHQKVYELQLVNHKIPVVTDNPKTGDRNHSGIWLGFAFVALGGVIALFILKKKGDK